MNVGDNHQCQRIIVAIRIFGAALVARLTPEHPVTAARLVAMRTSCRQYSVEKMSALTNPKWIDF